jgi:hypothetical protein
MRTYSGRPRSSIIDRPRGSRIADFAGIGIDGDTRLQSELALPLGLALVAV